MKEGGLPQLDPTWYPSQLFWLAVTFLYLYVVMSRLIVPRIHEVLENRQERISHDLDWAASLKSDAEQAQDTYETALTDARGKAQAMLNDVTESIRVTADAKHHELDVMLAEKLAESEAQIDAAMKKAQDNLTPMTEEVTGMMVNALLAKESSADLVKKAVAKVQKEYGA